MAEVRKKFDLFMIVNITILCLFGLITLLAVMNVVAKAFSDECPVITGLVLFWPVRLQVNTVRYVLYQP